jgi:hypothetical protein
VSPDLSVPVPVQTIADGMAALRDAAGPTYLRALRRDERLLMALVTRPPGARATWTEQQLAHLARSVSEWEACSKRLPWSERLQVRALMQLTKDQLRKLEHPDGGEPAVAPLDVADTGADRSAAPLIHAALSRLAQEDLDARALVLERPGGGWFVDLPGGITYALGDSAEHASQALEALITAHRARRA